MYLFCCCSISTLSSFLVQRSLKFLMACNFLPQKHCLCIFFKITQKIIVSIIQWQWLKSRCVTEHIKSFSFQLCISSRANVQDGFQNYNTHIWCLRMVYFGFVWYNQTMICDLIHFLGKSALSLGLGLRVWWKRFTPW